MTDLGTKPFLEPGRTHGEEPRRQAGSVLDRGRLPTDWHSLGRRAPWLWPYGGLALLLALVVWPAWLTADQLILTGDTALIHYPWFVFWRDQLAAGQFPFWNPYTFSGMPAFAISQAGYGYPLHWALTWLPPITAINWLVGLHVLLAGVTAAWCCGRLGGSKDGQFLAGVAFALGSATTARLWAGHLSFLESIAWLPLATGLAARPGERHRIGLLALTVALIALGAQPEVLIFSLWWLPLWAGLSALRRGPRAAVGAALYAGIGAGLGVGLAAFLLLPVAEVVAVSNRQAGMPWEFRTAASLPPWQLLQLINPRLFGDPHQTYWPGPWDHWHELLLYVGLVPLLAAVWARGRWAMICWGSAILAVALAFGRYAPWYAWTDAIPGYQLLRTPGKHLFLAALALALAAGLGIPRLSGRGVAVVAAISAVLLAIASVTPHQWLPAVVQAWGDAHTLPTTPDIGSMATLTVGPLTFASALMFAVALVALLPTPWSRRGILALAVVELILMFQPYRVSYVDPGHIVAQAGALRDQSRAAIVSDGAILANYGPVLGVVQPAGYTSLFSRQYMELLTGYVNPSVAINVAPGDERILRLLGYNAVIDREASQVTIYEPPAPMVWVAHCTWPGGAQEVREPGFPCQSCVTHSAATVRDPVVPPGAASILAERPGWLMVEATGPGWLVTVQPWYPGWSARVDDEPAPVEVVDGALVGVALPAGEHTIVLSYRPAGLELGIAISVSTALALIIVWWWGNRSARSSGRGPAT